MFAIGQKRALASGQPSSNLASLHSRLSRPDKREHPRMNIAAYPITET